MALTIINYLSRNKYRQFNLHSPYIIIVSAHNDKDTELLKEDGDIR